MKLYNKTKIPDEILAPVLTEAGKSVGARTGKVIVKVTTGRSIFYSISGKAYSAKTWYGLYEWFLLGKRKMAENGKYGRLISTDGGYIELIIRTGMSPDANALDFAQRIFGVAAHEWKHIKDSQQNVRWDRSQRNRRHDNRPWERVANSAADKAIKHLSSKKQDAILNLAIWLEENR